MQSVGHLFVHEAAWINAYTFFCCDMEISALEMLVTFH